MAQILIALFHQFEFLASSGIKICNLYVKPIVQNSQFITSMETDYKSQNLE